MKQKPDGGPAYPHIPTCGSVDGMSLRYYFAGQALAGVLVTCQNDTRLADETSPEMFARKSYEVADAMIAAREQGK